MTANFYPKNENGVPTGVAFSAQVTEEGTFVAASRCSRNDNYSKKRGRMIAQGRLEKFMKRKSGEMTAFFPVQPERLHSFLGNLELVHTGSGYNIVSAD